MLIACIFEDMQPSNEKIEEYRKAYAEEFGEEISPEEACEQLMNLVELLEVISKRHRGIRLAPDNADLTKTAKMLP